MHTIPPKNPADSSATSRTLAPSSLRPSDVVMVSLAVWRAGATSCRQPQSVAPANLPKPSSTSTRPPTRPTAPPVERKGQNFAESSYPGFGPGFTKFLLYLDHHARGTQPPSFPRALSRVANKLPAGVSISTRSRRHRRQRSVQRPLLSWELKRRIHTFQTSISLVSVCTRPEILSRVNPGGFHCPADASAISERTADSSCNGGCAGLAPCLRRPGGNNHHHSRYPHLAASTS